MDYKEKKEMVDIVKKINYNHPISKNPEFKNINLFKEQLIIVQAMINIENNRNANNINFGCLSERYGFGKTIIILALIKLNKLDTYYTIYKKIKIEDSQLNTKKIFPANRILKPSIVFSNKDNADNWYKTIKQNTSLKSLYVRGIIQMRKLNTLIQNNKINEYDVIIVKNGTTNSSINIENKEKKQKHLINIVANITRYKCWSRSIFDLDISIFKKQIFSINALFTWFVEVKNMYIKKTKYNKLEHDNIHDVLVYDNMNNISLQELCNVKFDKCINTNKNIGTPNYYVYKVNNGDNKYKPIKEIKKIYNLFITTPNVATQMINTNVNEFNIYSKIFKHNYYMYILSYKIIEWINSLNFKNINNLKLCDEKYTKIDAYNMKEIIYRYNDIKKTINDVYLECKDNINKFSKLFNRIKNSINSGECFICYEELKGNDIFIPLCCGQVVCSNCCIRGCKFKSYYNSIEGKCMKCRSIIDVRNILFVNKDVNLKDIKYNIDDIKYISYKDATSEQEKNMNHIEIINKIIKNDIFYSKISLQIEYKHIITGDKKTIDSNFNNRKILIYVPEVTQNPSMDNLKKNIIKLLKETKSNYLIFPTNKKLINETLTIYNNSLQPIVLLMFDKKCNQRCDLDIVQTTDLILIDTLSGLYNRYLEHRILRNIQRFGRKPITLNIHLLSDNEDVLNRIVDV